MFARLTELGFFEKTLVYSSVTDSFSYTVWHHLNFADAVKPRPPSGVLVRSPDANSYLHIAVVPWEPFLPLPIYPSNDIISSSENYLYN